MRKLFCLFILIALMMAGCVALPEEQASTEDNAPAEEQMSIEQQNLPHDRQAETMNVLEIGLIDTFADLFNETNSVYFVSYSNDYYVPGYEPILKFNSDGTFRFWSNMMSCMIYQDGNYVVDGSKLTCNVTEEQYTAVVIQWRIQYS